MVKYKTHISTECKALNVAISFDFGHDTDLEFSSWINFIHYIKKKISSCQRNENKYID